MIRTLIFALALMAAPAAAEPLSAPVEPAPPAETAPPEEAVAPQYATVNVRLTTSIGPLLLALETERAPITSAYFLRYVDEKRLDSTHFYRALTLRTEPPAGLVQGGIQGDRKRALPPVAHEPTSRTGLSHVDGTLSLARGAPGTATADFFIIVGDLPSLDADPAATGDNQGYAAFGRVVEGMDIIHAIMASPVSPTLGEGAMKGQMLEPKIRIISARRVAGE